MMWSAALVAIAAVGGPNHPETVVNITIPNNYLNRFLRAFCTASLPYDSVINICATITSTSTLFR
jgi:hypothetical protein